MSNLNQEKQNPLPPSTALTPPVCSPLEWECSTDGTEIRGYLKSRKDTTIFLIMVCKDRVDRGTMTGAFIPDGADGNGHLERALITFLKASASIYLREYYEDLREVLEPENTEPCRGANQKNLTMKPESHEEPQAAVGSGDGLCDGSGSVCRECSGTGWLVRNLRCGDVERYPCDCPISGRVRIPSNGTRAHSTEALARSEAELPAASGCGPKEKYPN